MDKPSTSTKILAGGLAGISETLVTYPAEFIKTRRQLPHHITNPPTSLSIIRSTYRSSGASGFYAGCRALVVSNAFKAGIRFTAFEASRDYLDRFFTRSPLTARLGEDCDAGVNAGSRHPAVNILAGMSAGIVESILVVTPGEALKTRMVQDAAAAGSARSAGLANTAVSIVRNEGILALWKGLGPVLCKQGTNSAVRFSTFAMLQEEVVRRFPKAEGSVMSTLGIGAVSGIVTVYASMPFDNVKTRMQTSGHNFHGVVDCFRQTLRNDGVAAFWRGTSPRLVRLTLSSGITFAVYDQVVRAMKTLTQRNKHEEPLDLAFAS